MIRHDGWKLKLCPDDSAELFDLSADPCEATDRITDPLAGAHVADLRHRLEQRQSRVHDSLSLRDIND
jgi:arylsulfatase A-like enzyme